MSVRDAIIREAQARAGLPYRLDPPPDGVKTIDCSLYVLKVAEAAGVPLPKGVRTAEQIRQATVPIPFADVKPGDLLYFERTYDAAGPAGPDGKIASHIGISLGAGTRRMWHAAEPVSGLADISTPYWQDRLFEARRLPGLVSEQPAPSPTLRGIDVASHQGRVDWPAVAASGQTFAITKATGGTWYRNPTFAANWLGIKAAGLVRGAYHYAFETSGQPFPGDGPEAEASYFVAELQRGGGIEPGDLLALDIEDGDGPLGQWALKWCEQVARLTGVRPIVYTGAWFSGPHGFAAVPELAAYPLWLAAYVTEQPSAPPPWREIAIWQHSSSGRVPGITGDVDLNVFQGTREELLALGKPGAVAPPVVADPRDLQLAGLLTAVAHLADVVVPKAAAGAAMAVEAVAEAQRIREQFVGPKPAA